jgi:autotransporter-associated beta strand protein
MANPLASSANQLWIGGSPDGGDGTAKMNGLLDEVYLFNRALSPAEVQSLYDNNTLSTNGGNVLPAATAVNVASGATLDLGGVSQTIASLAGDGSVTNTGNAATLTVSNRADTTTFTGSLGDASAVHPLSFVQAGGGTTILSGANTYRGTTTVAGGTLFVNGSIGSGATLIANGTLGGHGVLGGPVTVQAGGAVAPGDDLGVLTVNNDVTLQAGSQTRLEIDPAAHTNDQLSVSGSLAYGGTLVVSNRAGTLTAGDRFKLFQAGAISGSFDSNSLPALATNLTWNTADLNAGWLSVVSTMPTNLVWSVEGTNLNLSWPAGYVGWRLQVQTNSLSAGLGTNWVDVPGSSATNRVALPTDNLNGSVFYRLVY